MELSALLEARKASTEEKSYTKSLLVGGPDKIGAKIREEAGELADAIKSESDERVLSEAGDLLYHALVGLTQRGLTLRQVIEVLAKRTSLMSTFTDTSDSSAAVEGSPTITPYATWPTEFNRAPLESGVPIVRRLDIAGLLHDPNDRGAPCVRSGAVHWR